MKANNKIKEKRQPNRKCKKCGGPCWSGRCWTCHSHRKKSRVYRWKRSGKITTKVLPPKKTKAKTKTKEGFMPKPIKRRKVVIPEAGKLGGGGMYKFQHRPKDHRLGRIKSKDEVDEEDVKRKEEGWTSPWA